MENQIINQRALLENIKNNIADGRYRFKSGKVVFDKWVLNADQSIDFVENIALLIQADREMVEIKKIEPLKKSNKEYCENEEEKKWWKFW